MTDRLSVTLLAIAIAGVLAASIAPALSQTDAGADSVPAAAEAEVGVAVATTPAVPETPTAEQPVLETPGDAVGTAVTAVKQGIDGQWWAMVVTIVTLLVWGLRYSFKEVGAFKNWVLESTFGGPAFTLAIAFLATFGPRMADGPPGLDDLKVAGIAAVIAIGGWHALLKRLAIPLGLWAWGKVSG